MKYTRIAKDTRASFYQQLERYLGQFRKRGVSYVMSVHSETTATIQVSVSGRSGVIERTMIIYNDSVEGWIVLSFGIKYTLVNLSELSTVCRSIVRQATVLINRL